MKRERFGCLFIVHNVLTLNKSSPLAFYLTIHLKIEQKRKKEKKHVRRIIAFILSLSDSVFKNHNQMVKPNVVNQQKNKTNQQPEQQQSVFGLLMRKAGKDIMKQGIGNDNNMMMMTSS